MDNENLTEEKGKKTFWNSTLGTIAKITALVTAISGLIYAIKPFFKSDTESPQIQKT